MIKIKKKLIIKSRNRSDKASQTTFPAEKVTEKRREKKRKKKKMIGSK